MERKEPEKLIYARNTLEFVATATQFCAFLEQSEGREKREFIDGILKLLPMLYLKATMLPKVESNGDAVPSPQVTEADYTWIRQTVYDIMKKDDDYEDLVYDEDMQTEEAKWKTVSEGLADIYQPLRNFVYVYQERIEEGMNDALWSVMEDFELYWGMCLTDTLKHLHKVRYVVRNDAEEDYPE